MVHESCSIPSKAERSPRSCTKWKVSTDRKKGSDNEIIGKRKLLQVRSSSFAGGKVRSFLCRLLHVDLQKNAHENS